MIKKKLINQYYIKILEKVKSGAGFTLIELIVVLSVAAVISVIGIAAFVSYNQTQSLNTAAADIANMFSLAKSRAASGVKPSTAPCSVQTLNGYQISISIVNRTYQLDAVCSSGDSLILRNTLPSNISFGSASSPTFFFPVLTGGFTRSGTIVLSGFGKTKNIIVDPLGNVR